MWGDITAIDMKLDEILVAGHESGIIYTQSIKGEVKITEMQLHNYHLVPIVQICLPCFNVGKQSEKKGKFIALASNMVLTLFSMDTDRPLKVMSFAQGGFSRILYVGKNEVLAFDNKFVLKIDLHDAQVFTEQNKR